jgi:uncharacterized protein YutE (UPF0331/DUF86 family)
MTSPGDELRQKLTSLEDYLDELDRWLTSPAEPTGPLGLRRIVERLLQVIVECAADASDLWLAEHGHAPGESMRGVFRRLQQEGVISLELEQRFANYTGIRNRIVHDYNHLDAAATLAQAPRLLADARTLLRLLVGS